MINAYSLAFNKAAAFEREEGAVKVVGLNGFGFLNPDSDERYLFTQMANVCAGLALVSTGNRHHGLMHIFSDKSMYRYGREKIEAHVRRFWQQCLTRLPTEILFTATAFGGNTSFVDEVKLLDEEESDFFYAIEFLTQKFRDISGADPVYYDEKPEYRSSRNFKEAEVFLDKNGVDFKFLISHLTSPAYLETDYQMSAAVSVWINDALYDVMKKSGRVSEIEDLRYCEAPHDAVIDSETGETFIGRFNHDRLGDKMATALNERHSVGQRLLPVHHIFDPELELEMA